jgi:hypothetical protein
MATITEALQTAAQALNNAVASVLGLRAELAAKIAAGVAENKQIVAEAIPILRQWVVDPVNGSDNNDGRTFATAFKTLHAVALRAAPSTKHLVFLMGDIVHEHYSNSFADISVRGSTNTPDNSYQFASTRRRITFRPEAINSPLFPGYRATSGFALGTAFTFYNVDIVIADVPDGLSQVEHFRCGGGSVNIDSGDIYATTPSNVGRLIGSVSTIPPGIWISGAIAAAARGRIFGGVAAGADPNAGKRFNSNLTTN